MKPQDTPRLVRVKNASKVYFWSIKYKKLMKATNYGFKKAQCDLCIDHYIGYNQKKKCTCKFDRFSKLIRHIVAMENRFARELVWSSRKEIPNDLIREREIGDLSSLEDECSILRIVFDSITLTHHNSYILDHLSKNGCPCLNHLGLSCKTNVSTRESMFLHLSVLERKNQKYFVYSASVNDIQYGNLKFEQSIKSNEENNNKLPIESNEKNISPLQSQATLSNIEKDLSFAAFKVDLSKSNSAISYGSNQSTPKAISKRIKGCPKMVRGSAKIRQARLPKKGRPSKVAPLSSDLVFGSSSTLKQSDTHSAKKTNIDESDIELQPDKKAYEPSDFKNLIVDEAIDIVFVNKLPPTPQLNTGYL